MKPDLFNPNIASQPVAEMRSPEPRGREDFQDSLPTPPGNLPLPRTTRPRLAAYIAFFAMIFASMAAAAAVVSTEAPMIVVGLY